MNVASYMLYVSPVAKPPFATKIFKVKRLHHKTLRALTSPHSISSLWQETQVALDEISPSQTSMVTAMNAAPKSETPRIAKLLPFLCSHELAAKAASHLRRRLASSRQSGLWKQQSDHEPNQLVSHVVSHVSQASFLSESHQMETWHLKSPYFSSDTDSSPSFQVQSQGYTYTTCAECILDVAQKTARLQVWLWFCYPRPQRVWTVCPLCPAGNQTSKTPSVVVERHANMWCGSHFNHVSPKWSAVDQVGF